MKKYSSPFDYALKHWGNELQSRLASSKTIFQVYGATEVAELYPQLAPICSALRDELHENGIDMAARFVEADAISFGVSAHKHRALLCMLPDRFETALSAIATAVPLPSSLELGAGAKVVTEKIAVTLADGSPYSFHIELEDLREVLTNQDFLTYGRIAYCAGGSIAVVEFTRSSHIDFMAADMVSEIHSAAQRLERKYITGGGGRVRPITHMPWFGSTTKRGGSGQEEVALIPVLDTYAIREH